MCLNPKNRTICTQSVCQFCSQIQGTARTYRENLTLTAIRDSASGPRFGTCSSSITPFFHFCLRYWPTLCGHVAYVTCNFEVTTTSLTSLIITMIITVLLRGHLSKLFKCSGNIILFENSCKRINVDRQKSISIFRETHKLHSAYCYETEIISCIITCAARLPEDRFGGKIRSTVVHRCVVQGMFMTVTERMTAGRSYRNRVVFQSLLRCDCATSVFPRRQTERRVLQAIDLQT